MIRQTANFSARQGGERVETDHAGDEGKDFESMQTRHAMKGKNFIFSFLLLSPFLLSAQDFWRQVNFPAGSGTIFSIIHIDGATYLAGTSSAIYVSHDDGENWSKQSEIAATTITAALLKTKPGTIIAGTSRGAYRSTDRGVTWTQCNTGIDNPDLFSLLETFTGKIYAGADKGCLYASTDDGQTWTKVLAAAGTTIFESLAMNSRDMVFAGTYNAYGSEGVYRSTDDGTTWTKSATGLVGATAWTLKVTAGDLIYAGSSKGVHKSTDDGATWQQLINGMPSAYSTNCLALCDNGHLYVGTVLNGAYYSTDGGASWNALNSGLTNRMMQVMALMDDGHLLAGGSNSALFKSNSMVTEIEKSPAQRPDDYFICQNYPNPFNPGTIIKYSIPANAFVTLQVYNPIGKELGTLVHERQAAGTYEVKWQPESAPGGVYYYKINAGSFSRTGKMTLLR
ncbi:T9SS type A sorting domain-containing protein [candidate division KSB1 bacterium]|nr:T9SS type A sorting domain-containing protein [candidate division KSB1 bacterium]RQW06505.1 MAG: T9SS C-terminal target domain-containing protein [candidate division KSB1 bacterium]